MHAQTPPPSPQREISDSPGRPEEVIRSALPPAELATRLARAGRRGKVPGFDAVGPGGFRIDCDAVPFEYALLGKIEPSAEGGSVVTLRTERRRLMPTVFALTLAFTVWPGVWLTDSLMGVYWAAYGRWSEQMPWLTYAWYLPISVLPLPWVWRGLTRKSEAMAAESKAKIVTTIQSIVEARSTG